MNRQPNVLFFAGLLLMYLTSNAAVAQTDPSTTQYDSLQTVLEEIFDADQAIRFKMGDVMFADSVDSAAVKTLTQEMQTMDSTHQQQVEQILSTYGWLPQSKIGEKAAKGLWLVVQHADLPMIQQYYPLMEEMVEQGEADQASAATMLDRMLMYEGKKQVYGTQGKQRTNEDGTTETFIWPIKEVEQVNERREEVGIPITVENYAKMLNATFDPNEPLPDQESASTDS